MKRLFTLLTAVLFTFATLTQSHAATFKQTAPVHTKKDGTADKRFKENKTVKGPTKKDGTPDMRYKANKPTAKAATKPKGKK